MSQWNSFLSMMVFLAVFGVIYAVGIVTFLRAYGDRKRAINRLRNMADDAPPEAVEKPWLSGLAQDMLPRLGSFLFPKEGHLAPLKRQMLQAGIYRPNAVEIFLGVKLVLMLVLPPLAAATPFLLGLVGLYKALVISLSASCVGMILPTVWLESKIRKRHKALRQGLPDALDMLVLCLEGGISMTAAFQRVTGEVLVVHPILGDEMNIMQREIQLGLSTGDALKKMGERCGLDDVRELASVLLQSERYGASVVKALRMHADSWRAERQQRIEELAQKTAVKILFPTLLCIFPAIFIVLLGPAAFQMANLFTK